MWNDTDIPLAYLITFRCYGTWLHGDERGSVNRFRKQHGTERLPSVKNWVEVNKQRLKYEPVILDAAQRKTVESAIKQTCNIRGWDLLAINVRTNHVHCVIGAGVAKPEIALNALKTNATREMKTSGCWNREGSPWVSGGSKRYLWNEKSIERAIDYVLYGQGDELPDFD